MSRGPVCQENICQSHSFNLIYWRVALSRDGTSVVGISRLAPDVLQRPLDITVGADGTVYVAEMGASRITYFVPAPP